MAICFELVVNFGDDLTAAQRAALIPAIPSALRAGSHRIPLHRPLITTSGPYVELSILPVGVSYGLALDGTVPKFGLTESELTELGSELYRLLAKFDGYVAAIVGWDPEPLLDPAELKDEWPDELAEGKINGLVLCDRLHGELGLGDSYVVFQPGYRWMPYRGQTGSKSSIHR